MYTLRPAGKSASKSVTTPAMYSSRAVSFVDDGRFSHTSTSSADATRAIIS